MQMGQESNQAPMWTLILDRKGAGFLLTEKEAIILHLLMSDAWALKSIFDNPEKGWISYEVIDEVWSRMQDDFEGPND